MSALLLGAAAARAAERAAEGRDFLAAAGAASHVVVGTSSQIRRIDVHGFDASLAVERSLAGSLAPGANARIAWEELAQARPPRFAEGERILVALEPLPGSSLWRERFPKRDALAVADRGAAFVRDPDGPGLERLASWLALPPEARKDTAGVAALAALVADAGSALAGSALRRLDDIPGLATRLDSSAAAALARALADPSRPQETRAALLGLAGRRGLAVLRPAVDARAQPGDGLEAPALDALAALDGGAFAAERVTALLARPEGAIRAVGVRRSADALSADQLAELVRSDPAAEVREAALTRVLERDGLAALPAATPALFDSEPRVRGEAARRIAELGEGAIPTLERLANESHGNAALGPLAALSLAGPEGTRVLRAIAAGHPDESVRRLALLALGKLPADRH
jgi:hypothetical protein